MGETQSLARHSARLAEGISTNLREQLSEANAMKSLNWHTTQLGERVFTHHVRGAALHSATIIGATGRKRVRVLFDDNRAEAWRKYAECFPVNEVFLNIRTANARATVEFVQTSANGAARHLRVFKSQDVGAA